MTSLTKKKKKPAKQTAIDLQTGEIKEVDTDESGMTEQDLGIEEEPVRGSQAKLVAELTGIVLKPNKRVFALKITSSKMIDELTRIYKEQKSFMMKFKVPVEMKQEQVKKWETVEFETTLADLSLKGGKATCHGHIGHKGACQMSELIQNWNGPMLFFLDGVQQSIF